VTAAFVAFVPIADAAGFPPIAALLLAILVVLVPVEAGIVWWAARRPDSDLTTAVPYQSPFPVRDWLWLVPVLIVAAFVGFGLSMAFEPQLIDAFFRWLPGWFVSPLPIDRVGDYSAGAWIVTFAAYFTLNGLVGPVVEELYFRGYLLPRMEWLGRWASLVNVSLFSLYHFWSPWQLVARIIGLGPTVYAVRWKRNVYLGMVVHCSLNLLGVTLVAGLVFGRL